MNKHIIFLCGVLVVLLSSCSSTYFYSTLNTTNEEMEKVDNGDFLYENDSLWIAYCFKGEDAPIQITVFNKLDIPLYVDWTRSALILSGTAYPYDTGEISYFSENISSSYGDSHYASQAVSGNISLPKNVSFIPPKTMISHRTLRLSAKFDKISKKQYTRAKLATKGDKQLVEIKRIRYDYDNSPLHFGSYVTIYADPRESIAYESDFHVTNLIKTNVKPENLPSDMAERGDTFYQHKRPNNTGWYVLADVAIVTGAVALDVLVFGNDDD